MPKIEKSFFVYWKNNSLTISLIIVEYGGTSMVEGVLVERGPPRFKLRRSFLFWGHKRPLTRGHKRPRL